MHQELCFFVVHVNRLVVENKGLFVVFQSMATLCEAVRDACVALHLFASGVRIDIRVL